MARLVVDVVLVDRHPLDVLLGAAAAAAAAAEAAGAERSARGIVLFLPSALLESPELRDEDAFSSFRRFAPTNGTSGEG